MQRAAFVTRYRHMLLVSLALMACSSASCALPSSGNSSRKVLGEPTVKGEPKIVTRVSCPQTLGGLDAETMRAVRGALECFEVETPRDGKRSTRSFFFVVNRSESSVDAMATNAPRPLVIHFGGPSTDGSFVATWALSMLAKGALDRPVIGFSQPGTAQASFLPTCPNLRNESDLPTTQAEYADFVAQCVGDTPPDELMAYLTANNPVRDLKALHQTLFPDTDDTSATEDFTAAENFNAPDDFNAPGDPNAGVAQLDFWGVSYGTTVARLFDKEFPGRVNRMLMTGVTSEAISFDESLVHAWAGYARFLEAFSAYCNTDSQCSNAFGENVDFIEDLDLIANGDIPATILENHSLNPSIAIDLGRSASSFREMGVFAALIHGLAQSIRESGSTDINGDDGLNTYVSTALTQGRRLMYPEQDPSSEDYLTNREYLEAVFLAARPQAGPEADIFTLINCVEGIAQDTIPSAVSIVENEYDAYRSVLMPAAQKRDTNPTVNDEGFCVALRDYLGEDRVRQYRQRFTAEAPSYTPSLLVLSTFDTRTPAKEGWLQAQRLSHRLVHETSCRGHSDVFMPGDESRCDLDLMTALFSGQSLDTLDIECLCRNASFNLETQDGITFATDATPDLVQDTISAEELARLREAAESEDIASAGMGDAPRDNKEPLSGTNDPVENDTANPTPDTQSPTDIPAETPVEPLPLPDTGPDSEGPETTNTDTANPDTTDDAFGTPIATDNTTDPVIAQSDTSTGGEPSEGNSDTPSESAGNGCSVTAQGDADPSLKTTMLFLLLMIALTYLRAPWRRTRA